MWKQLRVERLFCVYEGRVPTSPAFLVPTLVPILRRLSVLLLLHPCGSVHGLVCLFSRGCCDILLSHPYNIPLHFAIASLSLFLSRVFTYTHTYTHRGALLLRPLYIADIHASCMKTWLDNKRRYGGVAACVLCRQPWVESSRADGASHADTASAASSSASTGYLNFAAEQGIDASNTYDDAEYCTCFL